MPPKSPIYFVGSLPFQSTNAAISFVKKWAKDLPFLPQLPEMNPSEDMVNQVMRGIELGGWDAESSACFEAFFKEFKTAPRVKIQLAGPFTVSRAVSSDFVDIKNRWVLFWQKLVKQVEGFGFNGELWVQIDEPRWSKDWPLPEGYDSFLCAIRGSRKNTKVGLHTCAVPRPEISNAVALSANFISLDYTNVPITPEEQQNWQSIWKLAPVQLVAGVIAKGKSADLSEFPLESDKLWLSSGCGLYGWELKEIEASFGEA